MYIGAGCQSQYLLYPDKQRYARDKRNIRGVFQKREIDEFFYCNSDQGTHRHADGYSDDQASSENVHPKSDVGAKGIYGSVGNVEYSQYPVYEGQSGSYKRINKTDGNAIEKLLEKKFQ